MYKIVAINARLSDRTQGQMKYIVRVCITSITFLHSYFRIPKTQIPWSDTLLSEVQDKTKPFTQVAFKQFSTQFQPYVAQLANRLSSNFVSDVNAYKTTRANRTTDPASVRIQSGILQNLLRQLVELFSSFDEIDSDEQTWKNNLDQFGPTITGPSGILAHIQRLRTRPSGGPTSTTSLETLNLSDQLRNKYRELRILRDHHAGLQFVVLAASESPNDPARRLKAGLTYIDRLSYLGPNSSAYLTDDSTIDKEIRNLVQILIPEFDTTDANEPISQMLDFLTDWTQQAIVNLQAQMDAFNQAHPLTPAEQAAYWVRYMAKLVEKLVPGMRLGGKIPGEFSGVSSYLQGVFSETRHPVQIILADITRTLSGIGFCWLTNPSATVFLINACCSLLTQALQVRNEQAAKLSTTTPQPKNESRPDVAHPNAQATSVAIVSGTLVLGALTGYLPISFKNISFWAALRFMPNFGFNFVNQLAGMSTRWIGDRIYNSASAWISDSVYNTASEWATNSLQFAWQTAEATGADVYFSRATSLLWATNTLQNSDPSCSVVPFHIIQFLSSGSNAAFSCDQVTYWLSETTHAHILAPVPFTRQLLGC